LGANDRSRHLPSHAVARLAPDLPADERRRRDCLRRSAAAARPPRLLTGERIDWSATPPSRNHIVGSVLFGIGWGISEACPGPTAAQLGAGRVLAVAVAAGVLAGVALQPRVALAAEHARRSRDTVIPGVQGAEVL
jgi:hypothetical protein